MAGDKEARRQYRAAAVWHGDGTGEGTVEITNSKIPISGSRDPGVRGAGASPEEILLASLAACFINTWAIFLKKLQVPLDTPALQLTGILGSDPAGGYKMLEATIVAKVPSTLLAERRAEVEKTLALSEKYCIISKVVRAAMPLRVTIEETD